VASTRAHPEPQEAPSAEAERELTALVGADNVQDPGVEVSIGLGRIVALHHRSSASYQIH
jgi:hypothetical protein